VLFQVELAFEGVVDRLDQLPHRLKKALALALLLALEGRTQQLRAPEGQIGLEL
jgi:hypothetical protein